MVLPLWLDTLPSIDVSVLVPSRAKTDEACKENKGYKTVTKAKINCNKSVVGCVEGSFSSWASVIRRF